MIIKYFGEIAEIVCREEEDIKLVDNTFDGLIEYLTTAYKIEKESIQIAVNHTIFPHNKSYSFNDRDEIAILSPFSGG